MNKVLVAAALASAWMYAPLGTPPQPSGTIVVCAANDGALRASSNGSCKLNETMLNTTLIVAAAAPAAAPVIADPADAINESVANLKEWMGAYRKGVDAKINEFANRLNAFDGRMDALATRADGFDSKINALTSRIEEVDARRDVDKDTKRDHPDKSVTEQELMALKDAIDARMKLLETAKANLESKIKAVETEDDDRIALVQKAIWSEIDALKKRVAQGEDDLATSVKTIYQEINALSTKISARQQTEAKALTATRVQAPFEVVTTSGKVMFRVSESQMDNSGRVTISPGSAGNYILGVYQGSGMLGAAIGESNQSGGFVQVNDFQTSGVILNGPAHAVQVFDSFRNVKALMRSDEKGGLVGVVDHATIIAYMTRSSGGGGSLTAALDSGAGYFSVDTTGGGAGNACINRQTRGGSIRGDCLGQGLPAVGVGR